MKNPFNLLPESADSLLLTDSASAELQYEIMSE
mgnify:CR=1 FL=1